MRLRTYRTISKYLQSLVCVVTLVLALLPKWGSHPNDFYWGYPKHFYVTQYDVVHPYLNLFVLLFDLLIIGAPIFGMAHVLLFALRRVVNSSASKVG
jgi:hypothetical protein